MEKIKLLEYIKSQKEKCLLTIIDFFDSVKNDFVEINKIREKFDLGDNTYFNFFTSISPIYYWENFHSDVLKIILDRNTKEIGSPEYMSCFLELIGCEPFFSKKDNIIVEREKGRIDLFLHNSKYGVIIENKIYDAKDQPNQLARYVEYVNDKGLEVLCIVYLTLVLGKKPLLNYDSKYSKYILEINQKIKYIPAVDKSANDLAHKFLDSCINKTTNTTAFVYLNQYKQLLLSLGRSILMKELEKEIFETIYSNKEYRKNMNDLIEIWKNKDNLLKEIIFERIKKNNKDYIDHDYGLTISKSANNNYEFAYHISGSYGFIAISGKKDFNNSDKKELFKILGNEIFNSFSKEVKNDDSMWIYRDINFNDLHEVELGEIVSVIQGKLDLLESEYRKLPS